MTGRVKFPSYLYVRVDRPLRAALVGAAEAQGLTVSDLARRELRKALATPLASVPAAGANQRHAPDGNFARTLRNISGLAEQARQIHKESGPAAAQAVIRGELVPKYLRLANEVQTAINTAKDTRIRDDWASTYGAALAYKGTLTSLGRLSSGDWSMAEMDAKTGSAA